MTIARKISISGQVQGVGFRFFTVRTAHRIGHICGYVRNMPDGTVEVYAEADEPSMEALIEALRQGPAFGRVDQIRIYDEKPGGDYQSFDVAF